MKHLKKNFYMKTINREFFEQLGNLFYSLAVDRSVEPIEFSELKMLISKDWMAQPQDSDLPIPEGVHSMFFTIDTLLATNVPSEEAYNDFARYYRLHPEVFTEELIERIHETVKEINAVFPMDKANKRNHFGDLLLLLRMNRKATNY
jgi:hypothetical protein